ncbi:hypothetical protein AGABI2DRAFT_116600 [Agaricus bisporus var. bisporus H97]|uniref:hypothetical protein n=1 Tax=Agaricus bisporus var. bisporus (strain H97 / ATCC MYA-4626 / FGSC 10389) TaxID=936046 RepID=UPI00029F6264|nr:hypothetical protein AGABI2DRAFT_116600 [Agaricus bisporus var. bisporus H97]EKV49566.1 hypothetical protein AGABI2DRAFT_116600 [Agaricus bisporus var. bisporus H97]
MAPRRKRNKIREWLLGFFSSKDEIHYMPDGPQRHTGPGGFFNNAQHSTVNNSAMTAVHGNQYFLSTEGDRNIATHIMKLLSDHIILGAAHDDSIRVPPPRCHPGTRVSLIARITAWFNSEQLQELLLWITGPAGVGKSAIVQTFAEYLVESQLLGASVFCSRPNKRNNPYRIFNTIAYQLAIRITAYREFLIERLSLDPQLLNRDMTTQFNAYIVEPFVEKKIGVGGKRWGILLDGLDELDGEDAQCEIIQLISTFTLEHRDAPLVWIIASRPESHISNTFDDDEVRRSCWSEYIPIDSTEACEDVDRFLRSSFKMIQKKYRHSVSRNWPSRDTDFTKLTAAASGLFIYAQVVMEFIRDPHHANPVSRLEVLLRVIDRSNVVPTNENPFVQLDALYSEILSSIPSTLWPTTKRLFGVAIYEGQIKLGPYDNKLRSNILSLRGMSILLDVPRNSVYASLDKSRSTLKIPDWKVAHKQPLTFLHASFSDYLKDSSRSGDFYIGVEENAKENVGLRLLEIWSECSGDDISMVSVKPTWHQYCSKLDDKSPSKGINRFYTNLFHGTVKYLARAIFDFLQVPMAPSYALLKKMHMRKLCYVFKAVDVVCFVNGVAAISPKPWHVGLLREVQLRDLDFGHLDWKEMSPACAHYGKKRTLIHRPCSSVGLKKFVSNLESLQKRSPELKVFIFGGVPKERVAVFRFPLSQRSNRLVTFTPYVIPYPE